MALRLEAGCGETPGKGLLGVIGPEIRLLIEKP